MPFTPVCIEFLFYFMHICDCNSINSLPKEVFPFLFVHMYMYMNAPHSIEVVESLLLQYNSCFSAAKVGIVCS